MRLRLGPTVSLTSRKFCLRSLADGCSLAGVPRQCLHTRSGLTGIGPKGDTAASPFGRADLRIPSVNAFNA